jgi:hypothetical protein
MQTFSNNNVGNIRYVPSIKWQGQIGSNKGFVVFDTVENGIRAMVKQINTYKERGLNTIQKIITTYAPAIENDTTGYIATVSKMTGVPSTKVLTPEDYKAVIAAMIKIEKGQNLLTETKNTINKYVDSVIAGKEVEAVTLGIGAVIAGGILLYFVLKK